jgi:D-sedoheptulose 7-phosphate isomerase
MKITTIQFLTNYWKEINQKLESLNVKKFENLKKKIFLLNKKNKVILVGNGGSASISSHVAVDLTKITGKKAICFNEANLITCFANDYGYENWVLESLKAYSVSGDIIILISSSGKSKNLINACNFAKKKNIFVATFTGFQKKNPLSKLGNINFWVDSSKYNIVEMVHHIWLLSLVDSLTNKKC